MSRDALESQLVDERLQHVRLVEEVLGKTIPRRWAVLG